MLKKLLYSVVFVSILYYDLNIYVQKTARDSQSNTPKTEALEVREVKDPEEKEFPNDQLIDP